MKIIDLILNEILCKTYKHIQGDSLYQLFFENDNCYAYLKEIKPAFLPHNDDITRIQIPNLPAFEEVIRSSSLFFAIGYDPVNNVYVIWNPEAVKPRLNKKTNISLYSTFKGQQEVRASQKPLHYVTKQLQDAMIVPPSEVRAVLDNYLSFFNTTETPVQEDMKNTEQITDWETPFIDGSGRLTRLANPKLLALLKSCFDSPYPAFVQAYNIIEDFYGAERFPKMQFKDWEYLLNHIDWNNAITVSPDVKPELDQEKPHKKNYWSDEEMILVLDLYYKLSFSKFSKSTREVQDLAKIIDRTPSSVAMRLCNYEYVRTGKGLSGGQRQCKPFLDKYENNREQLEKDAQAILAKRQQPTDKTIASTRNTRYGDFWQAFIQYNKLHRGPYADSKGSPENWLAKGGLGIYGVTVNIVLNRNLCRTELYFNTGKKEENKRLYDLFYSHKQEIDQELPNLIWQRLDDKTTCRIRDDEPLSFLRPEEQEAICQFFISTTELMIKVFAKYAPHTDNKTSVEVSNKPSEEHDIVYYKKCIRKMANETTDKKAIVCKLLLLLSTFEYVPKCPSTGDIKNRIPLLAAWEGFFLNNVKKYVGNLGRESTLFSSPFFLLEEEPYWRLIPTEDDYQKTGYNIKTFANLQDLYRGVELEEELVALIRKASSREELSNYIISLIRKSKFQTISKHKKKETPLEPVPRQERPEAQSGWEKLKSIFRKK